MKPYWNYLCYWLKHKRKVLVWSWRFGILWRGLLHDLSKLRPSEFIPHARYFFGGVNDKKMLDRAFLKHLHRNPHHWQYWVLFDNEGEVMAFDIPRSYLKEMLADWLSKVQQPTIEWFESHMKDIEPLLETRTKLWFRTLAYQVISGQGAFRGAAKKVFGERKRLIERLAKYERTPRL